MNIVGPKDLTVDDIPEFLSLCNKIFELKGKFELGCNIDFRNTKNPSLLGVLVFSKILEFGYVNSCFKDLSVFWSPEMDTAIEKFGFTSILNLFTGKTYDERNAYHAEVKVDDDFLIAPLSLFRSSDFIDNRGKRRALTMIERYYGANPKGVRMIFQCFTEVLNNFGEHSNDEQSLLVVSGNREQVEIVCADTGKGIVTTLTGKQKFEESVAPIEVAKSVNKGVTSKRKTNHMGYGLWLLNEIVTLVGGRLHLYSQGGVYRNDFGMKSSETCAYWGGTIIYITLPLKDPKTIKDVLDYQENKNFDQIKNKFRMITIDLSEYGPVISNRDTGDAIYTIIRNATDKYGDVEVDLKSIKSMATFSAKQIFGKLYLELKPENFFRRIKILNATDDLKLIIRISIQNALDDLQYVANA